MTTRTRVEVKVSESPAFKLCKDFCRDCFCDVVTWQLRTAPRRRYSRCHECAVVEFRRKRANGLWRNPH